MVDPLDEIKLLRSNQVRNNSYQQYQAHLDALDGIDEPIGKMHGKTFKKVADDALSTFVCNFFNRIWP